MIYGLGMDGSIRGVTHCGGFWGVISSHKIEWEYERRRSVALGENILYCILPEGWRNQPCGSKVYDYMLAYYSSGQGMLAV